MWPPHFESSGASYVFDARSGLFYDATSNFFYDPKLKLYYGNEKQKYYEYCGESGARPPFREVDNQEELASATKNGIGGKSGAVNCDAGQDLVVQALQGGAANHGHMKKDEKKKIAICLKKKPSGGKNSAKSAVNSDKSSITLTLLTPSSHAEKKHNADMEKWSKRGKEAQDSSNTMKGNDTAGEGVITPAGKCEKVSTKVKTTTSGKPVCLLCRRKFADIKKLRQHEKLSALHKENLLKQKKKKTEQSDLKQKKKKTEQSDKITNKANTNDTTSTKKKKTEQSDKITNKANTNDTTSTEYRDRAKERRGMYGTETLSSVTTPSVLTVEAGPSITNARVVTAVETVTPSQSLGESNIGNQLLQKLGWTKGSSLGRNGAISAGMEQEATTGESTADHLKKDWERIESLACSGGRRGGYRA